MSEPTVFRTMDRNGRVILSCYKCLAALDENLEFDQDYYTARQYFELMKAPTNLKCSHKRKVETKEWLLKKKIDDFTSWRIDDLQEILTDIVKRLP